MWIEEKWKEKASSEKCKRKPTKNEVDKESEKISFQIGTNL